MGWLTELPRRIAIAYREGLEMSCAAHCARRDEFRERAKQRREALRKAIIAHKKRRAH